RHVGGGEEARRGHPQLLTGTQLAQRDDLGAGVGLQAPPREAAPTGRGAHAQLCPAPGQRPSTLSPATTRSPSRTDSSTSGGRKMSIREPNFIRPIRSPLASSSPAL